MLVQVAITHTLLLAPVAVAVAATRTSGPSLGLSCSSLPRIAVLGLVPSALWSAIRDDEGFLRSALWYPAESDGSLSACCGTAAHTGYLLDRR